VQLSRNSPDKQPKRSLSPPRPDLHSARKTSRLAKAEAAKSAATNDSPTDVTEVEFSQSFAKLERLAEKGQSQWKAHLECARAAATLSNEELHAEGRSEAVRRYAAGEVDRFFPEPPSIARLIGLAERRGNEEAIAAALDLFLTSAMARRATMLNGLQRAKADGDADLTRQIGRRANALYALTKQARSLDAPVRARLTLCTRRVAAFRASCSVRLLPHPASADATLADVPPTRAGMTNT